MKIKKLLLFFILFSFFGCSQNQNDIQNIEIIKYLNQHLDSKLKIGVMQYAIIDGEGNAQTVNHRFNEEKFIKYKIDEAIIDSISRKTKNKNDDYFLLKEEDFRNEIYCGVDSYTRIRIQYKNKKTITFAYLNRTLKTKKYLDFEKLDFKFKTNKSTNEKIKDTDTLNLLRSESNFKAFTTHFEDDLLYPSKSAKVTFSKSKK